MSSVHHFVPDQHGIRFSQRTFFKPNDKSFIIENVESNKLVLIGDRS